jgi:two-component system, NarL family, sensor histidine kinase DevS
MDGPDLSAADWIDELPDGLLVVDLDGIVRVANEPLAALTGWAVSELVGMRVDALVPDAQRVDHEQLRRTFARSPVSRPMGAGRPLSLRRRDGELVAVEIGLAPLADHGRGAGVIAVIRDVTERLRAESTVRLTGELLALADERERIARDLHDTVLQRLFGLGLELQAAAIRSAGTDDALVARLDHAVDEIDLIIREIRTAVFTLGSAGRVGSLGQDLSTVISQAKRVLGHTPRLRLDGPVESATSPEICAELLSTLREALTNVARHAHATETEIELSVGDELLLRVVDNGRGMPLGFVPDEGNGIRSMSERARLLGGGCSVERRPARIADAGTDSVPGTELRWWVPLRSTAKNG